MAQALYRITLTDEEIETLGDIVNHGKHSAQKRKRAQAMLLAHQGLTDKENSAISGMRNRSIEDKRRHFVEHGFGLTLDGIPKKPRAEKLTVEDKTRLIALACEVKPDGHSHWPLRVLKEKFLALENIDAHDVSHETIRKTFKKATPTLATARMVHPAESQCGIRSVHGRHSFRIPPATGSVSPACLHG